MQYTNMRCLNRECRVTLSIPAEMIGRKVRCAVCGREFLVPLRVNLRKTGKGPARKAS